MRKFTSESDAKRLLHLEFVRTVCIAANMALYLGIEFTADTLNSIARDHLKDCFPARRRSKLSPPS